MMNKPFLTVLSPVSWSSAGYCRMGGSRARSPGPDQYSNFEKNLEEGTVFALQTAKSSRGSDEHVEMAILSPFGHVKTVSSIIVLAARNKTLIEAVFFFVYM